MNRSKHKNLTSAPNPSAYVATIAPGVNTDVARAGARTRVAVAGLLALLLLAGGCKKSENNPAAGAPPKAAVENEQNASLFKPDHPDQFPLATATEYRSVDTLNATGTVNPDIAREVPVISLASGRVVDIRARLGDTVKKGQLLMRVQSNDVATGFDQYLKAVNDERLANIQYERAKILYDKGAVAKSQLEIAETSEQDAKTDLNAAEEALRVLGVDKDHPSPIVNIYAPISGVIVAQNVTNSAAAGVAYSGSSNLFTIADLSQVWILCDVYENDIPEIKLGDNANIHLTEYPDLKLKGTVSDIGEVLDPSLRTAKVRLQVPNPGVLRVGMFVTATFHGKTQLIHAAVPASAVLHLHDRDWVYIPAPNGEFKRVAVVAEAMLPGNLQEIDSGIAVGQQVVTNALELQATVEQ